MKIKYLLIAVLAGAALVGCNKGTGDDSGEPNTNGGDTYVTFNIITPAATAEDTKGTVGTPNEFVNGSAEEAAYETIRFIFYRNGSKVAVSSTDNLAITDYQVGTVTTTGDPESDFVWDEQSSGGSVERIAQARVILRSNGAKPNQVLVFMNMEKDDFVEIAKKQTLNEALEMANDPTIGAKAVKPHNMFVTPSVDPSKAGQLLFVMSNSSHFNGSNKVYATEIPAAAIKETASAAVGSDAITVYLDRVASKVQVNLDAIASGKELPTTGDDAIVTSKNKPIKITPLNWSLNAVQRKTFWTKNIEYTPATWDDGSTRSLNRTWWAVDPNYNVTVGAYDSTFPNTAYQHNNQPGNWDLFYYDVAELLSHSDKKINNWDGSLASALTLTSIDVVDKSTANFNKTQDYFEKQYCLENTLGTEVANFRRTGTHVIILAQATVEGNQVNLYRYNNTFYEEADWKEALFGEAVGIQAAKTFWSGPADPTVAGAHPFTQLNKLTNLDDLFSIEKAMEDDQHRVVKCDKDNSDGLVSVFLTTAGRAVDWYVQKAAFPAGFNPATDVNDTNWATYFDKITQPFDDPTDPTGKTPNMANELSKAIVTVIEPTNAFTLGLLYFCVPIEHLNPISTGGTLEVGNYGVVRNHWYDITVSDIKGTGTGIYDPDEPIVPGDKTPNWYLAAKININAWHKVAQNGVELVD